MLALKANDACCLEGTHKTKLRCIQQVLVAVHATIVSCTSHILNLMDR